MVGNGRKWSKNSGCTEAKEKLFGLSLFSRHDL